MSSESIAAMVVAIVAIVCLTSVLWRVLRRNGGNKN